MSWRACAAAADGLTPVGAEAVRANAPVTGRLRVTAGSTSSTSSSRNGSTAVTAKALTDVATHTTEIHRDRRAILATFSFIKLA